MKGARQPSTARRRGSAGSTAAEAPGGGAAGAASASGQGGQAALLEQRVSYVDTALEEEEAPWFHRAGACSLVLRRAYDGLADHDPNTSLHDNEEVQKILSGVARVDVKLHYYRMRDDLSCTVVNPIEQNFMSVEPVSGSRIVNIAKVRNEASRASCRSPGGHSSSASPPPRSRSQQRSPPSSPPPRSRYASVAEPSRASPSPGGSWSAAPTWTQDRSARNDERLQRALATAREMHMERRVCLRDRMVERQSRSIVAARSKPWLTWAIASTAMMVMRQMIIGYRSALSVAKDFGEEGEEGEGISAFLQHTGLLCAQGCDILQLWQANTIRRLAIQAILDDTEFRRKNRLWKIWAHNVRLSIALVRFMRPFRRHVAMERCRDFIQKSWKGFRTRKAVKKFIITVQAMQKSMRLAFTIRQILQVHLIDNHVWAAETMILGRAKGIDAAAVKAAVDQHLETCDLGGWVEEAKRLMVLRAEVWSTWRRSLRDDGSGAPARSRLRFERTIWYESSAGGGRRQASCSSPDSGATTVPWQRQLSTASSAAAPAGRPGLVQRQESFKRPELQKQSSFQRQMSFSRQMSFQRQNSVSGRGPAGAGHARPTMRRSNTNRAQTPAEEEDMPYAKLKRNAEAARAARVGVLASVGVGRFEHCRLEEDTRMEIVARLFRENVDRWYEEYQLFKDSTTSSRLKWLVWRQKLREVGTYMRDLWPEHPPVVEYPQVITQPNLQQIHQTVRMYMRQHGTAD